MFYKAFGSGAVTVGKGETVLANLQGWARRSRCRSPVLTPKELRVHEELLAAVGQAKSMRSEVKDAEPEPESDCFELPSPRECAGEETASSSKGPFRPEDAWQTWRSCKYPTVVRYDFWNRTGLCDPPMTQGICLVCSGLLPQPDR